MESPMDPQRYYAAQSAISDPGRFSDLLSTVPDDVAGMCRTIQGLYIHYESGPSHGYQIPEHRKREVDTWLVEKILERILALDERPLSEPRPPEKRVVGGCRDASVPFCAMARYKGIPARMRVGFARYITPHGKGFSVDHNIAEYWSREDRAWRLVDTEQNDALIAENGIDFDVHDVPRDQFVVGGLAWQLCRNGSENPDQFGVGPDDFKGWWFIRDRVMQDLASLNMVETLCWDSWGLMDDESVDAQWELIDRFAEITQGGDASFEAIRAEHQADGVKASPAVTRYSPFTEPMGVPIPE